MVGWWEETAAAMALWRCFGVRGEGWSCAFHCSTTVWTRARSPEVAALDRASFVRSSESESVDMLLLSAELRLVVALLFYGWNGSVYLACYQRYSMKSHRVSCLRQRIQAYDASSTRKAAVAKPTLVF